MKKTLLIIACLMSSVMTFAQFSGSGSGTASDPYKIFNPIQLAQMANFLDNENVVFELKANIDLSDYISENYPSEGWAPIGTSAAPFKGTLKGNGYSISGLSINRSSMDYVGLFGSVSGATLSNFNVKASSITGRNYTGTLVGKASSSTIQNITINVSSKVSGNNDMGGVFGFASGTCSGITAIIQSGVSGTSNVGGMVGSTSANFTSCSINAEVISPEDNCGGFTGKTIGNSVFSSCKQNGEVYGGNYTSGFCGKSEGTPTFTDCWSRGRVTGNDYTGGILGYGDFLSMTGCSHSGDVSGNENVGGIYGGNDDKSEDYPVYDWGRSDSLNPPYTNTNNFERGDQVYRTIISCSSVGNVSGQSSNVGGIVGRCLIRKTYRFKSFLPTSGRKGLEYIHYYVNEGLYAYRNGVEIGWFFVEKNKTQYYLPTDYIDITSLQISNCYHNGDVKGGNNAGGIVGYNKGGIVQACYSNSEISGSSNVGGVAGYIAGVIEGDVSMEASITSSAAINSVVNSTSTTTGTVGRIYGNKGNYVTIGTNGTKDGNISINNTSVVANGNILSVSDDLQNGTATGPSMLKLQATYVAKGWDFTNGWSIQETESYPYMRYQTAPPVITSKLTSGATTISGKSVDGGMVYLYIGDSTTPKTTTSSGNNWSISTTALNSGDEIRVYALANGKEPSYYVMGTVSYQGTGTEADPYVVSTEADLQNITKSGYYKLSKDISLSSSWKSIGANGLNGVHLDGDNHTVTINNNYGLFAYLTNGSVKNMTIKVADGKTINTATYDDSRAIVVSSANGSAFSNLTVTGNVSGSKFVGGIVGTSKGCTYNSISYEGKLTSPASSGAAGGICAKSTNDKLEECNVKTTITASNTVNAGGVIGSCETTASTLTKISAEANINATGSSSKVGGIVGNGKTTISQSVSKGTVKATGSSSYAGGILGYNANTGTTISDCYSTADVNGSAWAAGIAAYTMSAITRCYATGNISGVEKGAGVVGMLEGSSAKLTKSVAANPSLVFTATNAWATRVIHSFSNGAPDPDNSNYALKSMQVTLNGTTQTKYDDPTEGIAKTKDELQTESFYKSTLGWDMTNTWTIKTGEYPTLKWIVASTEYTVTANSNDESMGTVTGSGTYVKGSEVTLEATPKTGYEFVKWSDGKTDNPYTFIVNEDVTITATFQKIDTTPISINNVTDLQNIKSGRNYVLESDLILTDSWKKIEDVVNITLNGNGHTITTDFKNEGSMLFGKLNQSKVENLIVRQNGEGAELMMDGISNEDGSLIGVGVIACWATSSTFSNIDIQHDILGNGNCLGGVTGYADNCNFNKIKYTGSVL